jgi:hypothetical protein
MWNQSGIQRFTKACREGDVDTVKAIAIVVSVNMAHGFVEACKYGHINVLEFLFSNEVTRPYCSGAWGFNVACCSGQLETVHYLFKKHVIVSGGLKCICREPSFNHLDVVRYLLEVYNYNDRDCVEIMESACENGHVRIVELLLLDLWTTNEDSLAKLLECPNSRYLAVFVFFSKFSEEVRQRYEFKAALHELCVLFLGLQSKGLPKDLIHFKIIPYL